VLLVSACENNKNRWSAVDISDSTTFDVHIKRYEESLFSLSQNDFYDSIHSLVKDYKVFLGVDMMDSSRINQLYDYVFDPLMQEIYLKCIEVYPNLKNLENKFSLAFQYYKYYFPAARIPEVYTYISGLDIQYPIGFSDSSLIIAIDDYLGPAFQPYKQLGLPVYQINMFREEFIVRDCFEEIADAYMYGIRPGNTFIDHMIYEGKRLYFLDCMLPFENDEIKILYTPEQLKWCKASESQLWEFILDNEFLYTPELQIINKFFQDGPFTRGFQDSPPRLGAYMGWQIVRSYMNRNKEISIIDLIQNQDSQDILSSSGYKPPR